MRTGIFHQAAELAAQLLGSRQQVYTWLLEHRDAALDHATATEMIWQGQGAKVIAHLRAELGDAIASPSSTAVENKVNR